jgi:hypothetical protein
MKKLIGIVTVLFILTGCGTQSESKNTSYGKSGHDWIEFYNPQPSYFVVTTEQVKNVGKQFSTICLTCNGPTPTANTLPSGTKLFEIPGQDPSKEFAVETSPNHYQKAVWYGTKQP